MYCYGLELSRPFQSPRPGQVFDLSSHYYIMIVTAFFEIRDSAKLFDLSNHYYTMLLPDSVHCHCKFPVIFYRK